ncbi:hypothetical protein HK413_02255 [Mucilaginibacter sp. S1162]|uniref:Uncharacterized protein n=1 Tax=Mucilaginibacter humi TaxID=2732510 RepID=A0ABX1W4T1_9SPHI|nr:hypothetical protein [Mucilaginibacter humi]NNU33285.1 hypothetical protein [Mucilaginibacter humi]
MLEINASIAKHKGRIWCCYRTKHLFQYDSKSYITELNADFTPISNRKLTVENGNTAFEDVRLFSTGEHLLAFYTYLPRLASGKWDWIFGVGMGTLDVDKACIVKQTSLRPMSKRVHEKNWTPYMFANELFLITDLAPFLRVLKLELNNGKNLAREHFLSTTRTLGWPFGELRGGTPLLQQPGDNSGWVYGFAHSYLDNFNGFKRFYYYTAIRYNHYRKILEYHPDALGYKDEDPDSEYKKLWHYSNNSELKIVFPMGIMYQDDGVLVSFGKDDVCSFTQHFKWQYLKSLFKDS